MGKTILSSTHLHIFSILFLLLGTPTIVTGTEKQVYGNTPEEFVPYHKFSKPYKQFFLTPNEYHGYGREIPEPDTVTVVKIGFLGPIEKTVSIATGGTSHEEDLGIKMLQGAELAIAHANEQGGYTKRNIPYSLVVKNDNGLWGSSANEIIDLAYREKVWAILGTIDGANSHIAIRTALKAEVAVMNSGDTDPTFTETAIPWAFRNITDDRQMCYALAQFIYHDLGITRVAALRANNRYGRIGIDEFRDAATRIGHPFITELTYKLGATDFSSQLSKIKALNPELVLTFGDAEESALLLNQIKEEKLDVWFAGSDRIVSPLFIKKVHGNLSKVIAPYPFNPDLNRMRYNFFHKAFIERYGEAPEAFAAHAYDAIFMIIDAIEKGGLNRAKIRDQLALMVTYDGVTGFKEFDAIFNNLSSPVLALGKNREFHFHTLSQVKK